MLAGLRGLRVGKTQTTDAMSFHFSLYLGRVLLSSRGVFVLRRHYAVKHPKLIWFQWDRVL
jgi:hypothetical protein